ncbi:MAG: hypothetical protein AB7P76_08775 [Candidatus Melainabacteria bacterium]
MHREYPTAPEGCRHGNVLVLTFFFIVLLTLEVAVVNLIAQRSLGEGAILSTQNISARYAQIAAFNHLEQDIIAYLKNSGASGIETAFAKGGANDIDETLDVTNPETGSSETGTVNIQGWIAERRGIWYKLGARAQVADIDLVAFRWIKINPCSTSDAGAGGVLSTIVSARTHPGYGNTYVSQTDGRVYFGDYNNYYTWHKDAGLSTITTGMFNQDNNGALWDQTNQRIYFADSTKMLTWKLGAGLSTVVSGKAYPGANALGMDSSGRIYFGGYTTTPTYTWSTATGLSTILNTPVGAGAVKGATSGGALLVMSNGTVFFGNNNDGNYYRYNTSDGLSTLVAGVSSPGVKNGYVDSTGRVWFAENNSPGKIWTWKSTTGLSTIGSAQDFSVFGGQYRGNMENAFRTVAGGSRILMGGTLAYLLTWNESSGLSTININPLSNWWGGNSGVGVFSDSNTFYFGSGGSPNGRLFRWSAATGLSTIFTSNGTYIGTEGAHAITSADRVYFGQRATAGSESFFTWSTSTGVSTILSAGGTRPGWYATYADNSGRVYFGEDSSTGRFFSWSPSAGLSTLVSSSNLPGQKSAAIHPSSGIYFGEYNGNFYYWQPGTSLTSCASRHY